MLHYTNTDQYLIAQADLFAATKHAGQSRKDGTPYIHHPRYVSVLAGYWAQQLFDEPVSHHDDLSRLGIIRVTGLCHDLIEDQNVSWNDLHLFFGQKVADFVLELSNDKSVMDHNERNRLYCDKLQTCCEDVQLIKLADIYHNAVSVAPSTKFGASWVKKARLMLASLNKVVNTIFYVQTANALKVRDELSCKSIHDEKHDGMQVCV